MWVPPNQSKSSISRWIFHGLSTQLSKMSVLWQGERLTEVLATTKPWSPHAFFNPVKFDPAKIGFEFKQHETVNLGIWNQQQTSDLDVYTVYMAKTMARLSSKIHSVDHLSGPTCPSQVHGWITRCRPVERDSPWAQVPNSVWICWGNARRIKCIPCSSHLITITFAIIIVFVLSTFQVHVHVHHHHHHHHHQSKQQKNTSPTSPTSCANHLQIILAPNTLVSSFPIPQVKPRRERGKKKPGKNRPGMWNDVDQSVEA